MKRVVAFFIVLSAIMGLCFGVTYGQATFEPQVIVREVETTVSTHPENYYDEAYVEYLQITQGELGCYDSPITKAQGLQYLYSCIKTHRNMADHPEYCNRYTGDVAFHRVWTRRYEQLLHLIKRVES